MTLLNRLTGRIVFFAFLGFAAMGCAWAQPAAPMRLGDAVRPLAYDLHLTIDPTQEGFTGRVEIDLDVKRATQSFRINSQGLELQAAVLTAGGQRLQPRWSRVGDSVIDLRFARRVPAGKARMAFRFSGRFAATETRGAFRQRERGDWYAFTQLESHHARRVFPSFDEPQWKTPWTVTLTVRREHVAVANTPMVSERNVERGMKQVRFARSLPLPTYLVAFGVGPFDVVDGGVAGRKKTPLRFIVPRGRAADAAFAVQATPRLLDLLEAYFGSPYPYEKLDSMAIPVTVAFGAMENAGLITYRSSFLLSRPGEPASERQRQSYASIGAHEIAHQWFGNLVTMKWWDDLWLNESFATWMASKISHQFDPAWEPYQRRESQRQHAFSIDRLAGTRQVRQPVHTEDDLADAFDGITYAKGGAVLSMYEASLGETAFRDGVRSYLNKHAWGNADANDFFSALAQADASVVPGFSSFVLQPGVPMVDFTLDCTGAVPAVQLRQQRFLPSTAASSSAQLWVMPVCLRHEGRDAPVCTMLQGREQRIELAGSRQCPAWIVPNPGGTGYFLSRLDERSVRGLAAARLTAREAIALLSEQSLLASSGAAPVAGLLELVAVFARDARPEVATAAAAAVWELHAGVLTAAQARAMPGWVRDHFGEHAAQLGWVERPGDSDAVRKLRWQVGRLVMRDAADAQLRQQARELALGWLAGDRARIGANYRNVLQAAASDADSGLFDALVAHVRGATDTSARRDIYDALGRMRDPALLRRAMELAVAPQVDLRESFEVFEAAASEPANAAAVFDFVRQHHDVFAARLPESGVARLARWQENLCTVDDRRAVEAFYTGERSRLPGAARMLAQTLEAIDICVKAKAFNASR